MRSGPIRTAALRTSFAKSSSSVGHPTPAAIRLMLLRTSSFPSDQATKGSNIDLSVFTSLRNPQAA